MANADFVCVLRASSRAPGLAALLRAFPRWKPIAWWKAGVPDAIGRVSKKNGFNLFIAEGEEWKPIAAALGRRLRALGPMIDQGRKAGADFELDVGVMLGGSRHLTRSAMFAPKDLAFLHAHGVELRITAYPVSERPSPRRGRSSGGSGFVHTGTR